MDRTTRYLFILLGVVIFFVLAPLIVLYISGTRFNLESRETTATGILVAKSVPDKADVYINDNDKDQTPATIRFLDRGDYQVKITKNGYLPWTKRLPVESGKVTYTYEGVDAVELLREPLPQLLNAKSVTSFALVDDVIWYSSGSAVFYANLDKPNNVTKINLPISASSLTELRNSSFLVAQNTAGKKILINRNSKTVFNLPDNLNDARDLNMTSNNFLLARRGDTVFSYNLTSRVLTPLLHNIRGLTLLDNTGYVAVHDTATTLQTLEWTGASFTNAQPIANSQIPGSGEVQLIITKGKELFVWADENFYRANAPLELISSHVKTVNHDLATDEISFITSNELWFYNFGTSKPQLLTSTTDPINNLLARANIGYCFISNDKGLTALEIDSRDQQNRYTLLNGDPVWATALSNNEKTAVALQNGQLFVIPIR